MGRDRGSGAPKRLAREFGRDGRNCASLVEFAIAVENDIEPGVKNSLRALVERATQRNEQAIQEWHEQRWPAIKKKRSTKAPPSSG